MTATAAALAALVVVLPPATASAATALPPCGSTGSPLGGVNPATTDPAISGTGSMAGTVCYGRPTGTPNGKLFVFFPGTGAVPSYYQDVLVQAQQLGFYTVGMSYNNGALAAIVCGSNTGTSPSTDCYGGLHLNRFNGTAESWSDTGSADATHGIEHRLTAALTWLAANDNPGWSAFLSNGLPAYGSLVVGGHSQGASEAAYLGSIRTVTGAVLFSSPDDCYSPDPADSCTTAGTTVAYWASHPFSSATPLSRYILATNANDPWITKVTAVEKVLGGVSGGLESFGAPVSVDNTAGTLTTAPPYGHSHVLLSNATGTSYIYPAHDEPVVDNDTPVCSTNSAHLELANLWRQMLYTALGSAAVAPAGC
ncbi:hypothetical protein [Frankia sp. AgB32]|uniref:BPSS1187 family protein n=1 Tax=Frankia sp. AgB32 TaxID=631119 RepID=UPI00200C0B7B|nr:hypothetical protein [Frankia sp. AgB32]